MLRVIHCKDEDGNNFDIKAIKHSFISNYEILIPNEYRIIHCGVPVEKYKAWLEDLDTELILKDRDFSHEIIIVNLNPISIDTPKVEAPDDKITLEQFKYLVANCRAVIIEFDGNNELEKLYYLYESYYAFVDDEKRMVYDRSSEFCEIDSYLMREKY